MKRRRLLLCLPGLSYAAMPLWAAEAAPALLTQVRQRLADAPVLRGEFEQRKALKGFKNPLVSRGDYLVAHERGVVWRTREPFASSLVVTRERMVSRRADGQVSSQMNASDEPALRAINEMLFALMAADLQTLSQRFRIEGELKGTDAWSLGLVPRDAALAQWVTRIDLEGARFVNQVKLSEALGDVTVIRFSAQATAQKLSPEEVARFE
jgi:hypothetical protein